MSVRRYVVSGARSGIGLATVQLLRQRGQQVLGIDLEGSDIAADLSTPEGRAHAIATVHHRHADGFDALILCAGVAAISTLGARIVAVNYFGTVHLARGLSSLLARGRDPRAVIVVSSSILNERDAALVEACLTDDEPKACALAVESTSAYASSKVALARWIRRESVKAEWAGAGILLNGVAPGVIDTPMVSAWLNDPRGRERLARNVPSALPGFGEPRDVAVLLDFLASADNRRMVGQIPFCDAGADVLLRGEAIH